MESELSYLKYETDWGVEAMPPVPSIPLHDLIRQTCYRYPNKTALVCCNKEITYSQMDDLSDRLANALIEQGVKKGERVGVMLPNSIQHVIAFHAIIKAGAVSVPCNVMF